MSEEIVVGRVLSSSTTTFTAGCTRLISEQDQMTPEFGAFVRVPNADRSVTYGLIYNVTLQDDSFVRQLVAAGVEDEVYIEDQRQNRSVPIVIDILIAGHGRDLAVWHRTPPQPPGTLDKVYCCNNAEIVRFTARHDWLRNALNAAEAPVDPLLPAALRRAASARPPEQRRDYLVAAGRELARLLALDPARLDGMLQQMREP